MLQIWGHKNAPNVRKVLWAATELGRAYHRVDIGGPLGGLDAPDYRAINPNGRIPAIRDGNFTLWESHAIMRYLAETTTGQMLVPPDVRTRALVNQWLDWQSAHQAMAVRTLVMLTLKAGSRSPDPERLAEARRDAESLFRLLDEALGRHGYIAGDRFSLADISLAIGYERWSRLPIVRPGYSSLADWFARLSARPAFVQFQDAP
jgi:glutathione S-transferase